MATTRVARPGEGEAWSRGSTGWCWGRGGGGVVVCSAVHYGGGKERKMVMMVGGGAWMRPLVSKGDKREDGEEGRCRWGDDKSEEEEEDD